MPNMRKLKIDKIILGERRRQLVQAKVDEIAECLGSRRQGGGVQLVLPFDPPLDHQCGRGGPCVLIAEIHEASNSIPRCLKCEFSGARRRA
jgi:hypothetical protein